MANRVCVLGSINRDLCIRSPRLPTPGETLIGSSFTTHPGGKGANQAISGARLGAEVTMIGAVGNDANGEAMRAILADEGVGLDAVRIVDDPTGVALITVGESDGENTIVVASGANATVDPGVVDAARTHIERSAVLLMQLEVPLDTVRHAARAARDVPRRGPIVMLNAAPAQPLDDELLERINVLIVNEHEVRVTAGLPPAADIDGAITRLLERGVNQCIVTLGADGCLSDGETGRARVPSYTVTPVDTVGAGDAFAGAIAARWGRLDGESLLRFASAAGAIAVSRHGAVPSLPHLEAVNELMARQGHADNA